MPRKGRKGRPSQAVRSPLAAVQEGGGEWGPFVGAVTAVLVPQGEPLDRLRRCRELAALLPVVERQAVAEARAAGESWASIGQALGVTGQAVSQRFRPAGIPGGRKGRPAAARQSTS